MATFRPDRASVRRGIVLASVLTCVVAGSCGSGDVTEGGASKCPAGSRMHEAVPSTAQILESRDAAVRTEMDRLEVDVTDDVIAAAIVHSSPAPNSAEVVTIDTATGPVTMTLAPQMPGWRVEAVSWCEPAER